MAASQRKKRRPAKKRRQEFESRFVSLQKKEREALLVWLLRRLFGTRK